MDPSRPSPNGHRHPTLGIPELAGVCRYEEVNRAGYGVEQNVALLKRYNWVETRLTDIILAHVTSTPEWEVKDALCLHVWLDAEHAKWLQERVAELRHPPHNFHQPPDEALEALLQEALRSRNTIELLTAVYRVIRPALLDTYRHHLTETHPLVDQPTRRFLRFIIIEEEEMIQWGVEALDALLTTDEARRTSEAWETHLHAYLDAAGGVTGYPVGEGGRPGEEASLSDSLQSSKGDSSDGPHPQPLSFEERGAGNSPVSMGSPFPRGEGGWGGRPVKETSLSDSLQSSKGDPSHGPHHQPLSSKERGVSVNGGLPPARAREPFVPDWTPRRDSRFESYNYHFPPHWIYAQHDRPADERMLALVCKRLLEMDVPEMMAAIIWRAKEDALRAKNPKPWDYTAEMCRQMWDEARHSMMGEAWLVSHGIDFTKVPLNIGFSLGLNEHATAREAHAALWWIEQGLMPKTTGKAYEWRTARDAGNPLATLFMDYDWADEVLHVHIGRRWLVKELGSREEAEKLGAEAFSRVMAIRRRNGLEGAAETEQCEWWPDFCEKVLGYRPAPLAAEVYETPDQDAPWLRNG